MIIDKFTQQPREVRAKLIDYSAFLGEDDELDAEEAVVTEVDLHCGDADDSESPFLITSAAVSAPDTLSYFAQGGADGNTYKATFLVDTVGGQTLEHEILFVIKEV